MATQRKHLLLTLGVLAVAFVSGVLFLRAARAGAGETRAQPAMAKNPAEAETTPLHPVLIKRPAGAPKVAAGKSLTDDQAKEVSCGACHATTTPNAQARRSEDLIQFHQGLKYDHGQLTCLSCHNAANYDQLRLADSRPVEFSDSMTLCSQCHGPQRRDYDRGLHGGMTGHWDLRRGGRTRSTCVNCHDPHAPAFPLVMPVFPPRDRFSVPPPAARSSDEH